MKINNTQLAIMVCIQIFIAGVSWGTLWTKVTSLEKRFDRFEDSQRYRTYPQPPGPISKLWSTITPEASADTTHKARRDDGGFPSGPN